MKFKHLLCVLLIVLLTVSCVGCKSTPQSGTTAAPQEDTTAGDETGEDVPGNTEESDTSSEDITDAPDESDPEETTGADDSAYTFEPKDDTVYTTANLNIRKGPSTDDDIVTVLPSGSAIKRTGYHEEWSRLEYLGETVYASSHYLTETEPTESDTPDNSELSNELKHYGYNRYAERTEQNMPATMNWYIRTWGKYADFVQDTTKKVIYLTMDEGYENGFTPMILDTLKEKKVTAVFFLTEQFVTECPHLVQRMIDEGHILGNHSSTHPAGGMPSLTVEEQKADIMNLHNMVLDQFGYEMKLFRYPSGIYSDQSLDLVTSLGYRSVFWSFFYRDYITNDQVDPAVALEMCLNELHPGAIYLLHAVSETNATILGDWIDEVRARGYEFGVYPINH